MYFDINKYAYYPVNQLRLEVESVAIIIPYTDTTPIDTPIARTFLTLHT